MNAWLCVYALIGPVACALLLTGLLMGWWRTSALRRPVSAPADLPPLTVLMPVKDEAAGIERAVRSVLRQDLPRLQTIVIDDRSVDGTGAVLERLAREHPRLRVLRVAADGLPDGWLGKPHALHVGLAHTRDPWVLMVDSDVVLRPSAAREALALAVAREYDAVSLLPRLDCPDLGVRLALPVVAAAWTVMHAVSLTNHDRIPIAAANGQFLLLRRDLLDRVGGYRAVRDQFTEDVELMRRLKSAGGRVRLFIGRRLIATPMYHTLAQTVRGWGRNFFGASRGRPARIAAALLLVLASTLSVYPALAWGLLAGAPAATALALLHAALLTTCLGLIHRWSGNSPLLALGYPLAAPVLLAALTRALWLCRTRRVDWRGTRYDDAYAPHAPRRAA